jgi:membrane-bound lytic murein transglycosylase B
VQRGDIPVEMNGSWAGAMGHTHHPTTYQSYAVDYDGMASATSVRRARRARIHRQLSQAFNWQAGQSWGYGDAAQGLQSQGREKT